MVILEEMLKLIGLISQKVKISLARSEYQNVVLSEKKGGGRGGGCCWKTRCTSQNPLISIYLQWRVQPNPLKPALVMSGLPPSLFGKPPADPYRLRPHCSSSLTQLPQWGEVQVPI